MNDLRDRIYAYRMDNPGGGCLHIVIEDGNIRNGDIQFSRWHGVEEQDEEGVAIADELLALTLGQRAALFYQGWCPSCAAYCCCGSCHECGAKLLAIDDEGIPLQTPFKET